MSHIQIQKRMKFVTVERPTAWLVVAFLVEFQDGHEVIVSEPKIVKVILKEKALALSGKKQNSVPALPAALSYKKEIRSKILSPYAAFFNTKETQSFYLFARPPTFV